MSAADTDAEIADYREIELVYCRHGFNIRQQRRGERQGPVTTTTLDADVVASLLDAAF